MKIRLIITAMLALSTICYAQQSERERQENEVSGIRRVEAVIEDVENETRDLNEQLRERGPAAARMALQTSQKQLGQLDEIFRTFMLYGPESEKAEFQRFYAITRQNVLNTMVLAQRLLEMHPEPPNP